MKRYSSFVSVGLVLLAFMLIAPSSFAGKAGEDLDYLDIPFKTISGEKTSLKAFQGDVILVVNVASKCGFTPQYEGLEALYREYGDRGLTVIGFPANDFLGQEPGSNEEILQFCRENYDVTFPMMAKIHVKGDDIHPLYRYLTMESSQKGKITWNFNKFLLNRQGEVVARFGSKAKPGSDEIVSKVEELLGGIGLDE